MDARLDELQGWLRDRAGFKDFSVVPAASDASFRRYFRVHHAGASYIVMDAPPDKEDCAPCVKVARARAGFGRNVPQLYEVDLARGFLLLGELGGTHYLQRLSASTADALYGAALAALQRLQAAPVSAADLLDFDRALLLRERKLFPEWVLGRHLGIVVDERRQMALSAAFDYLATSALAQPRVWVHRDYHSRNLMVTAVANPGELEIQEAVAGPVTYDLVSLLRDC